LVPLRRDGGGSIDTLLGLTHDITQRRRAERVQQATYRISEAALTAENLHALLTEVHRVVGELMPHTTSTSPSTTTRPTASVSRTSWTRPIPNTM